MVGVLCCVRRCVCVCLWRGSIAVPEIQRQVGTASRDACLEKIRVPPQPDV